MQFENIHIGERIKQKINESGISNSRICNFMKCGEKEILTMLNSEKMDSELLLKWSKLLEYDFFRMYSQHLILYTSAETLQNIQKKSSGQSLLPQFKKNIYTRETIDFILKLIHEEKKNNQEVRDRYNIPRSTLYQWLKKYKNDSH